MGTKCSSAPMRPGLSLLSSSVARSTSCRSRQWILCAQANPVFHQGLCQVDFYSESHCDVTFHFHFLGHLNPVSSSSPRAVPSHRRSQLHELPVQHRRGLVERLGRGRVLHGHGDAGRRPVGQLLVRQRAVRDAQHPVRAELHSDGGGLQRAV